MELGCLMCMGTSENLVDSQFLNNSEKSYHSLCFSIKTALPSIEYKHDALLI